MTYIVALTGGIGSGKTIVSDSFKKIGINIIDTDIIAKSIMNNNLTLIDKVKKKFGHKILNQDNSINRNILRKYIFNDLNHKLWIENLLHPNILKESQKQIKMVSAKWCLWVVPLLIEKKLYKYVHRVLLIDTSIKNQIKRIVQRDKIQLKDAKKIISLQSTRNQRLAIADDIINNQKNISTLKLCVYYLNTFYNFLFYYKNKKKYLNNPKRNYITKFY